MITLTLGATIVRSPELLFSSVEDDVVIFQVKQDAYFSLNQTGADIWRHLEQPITVAQLCDTLAGEYEAGREVIEADVLDLLADMAAAELIETR